jgi:hypothetical protein
VVLSILVLLILCATIDIYIMFIRLGDFMSMPFMEKHAGGYGN